MKNKRKKSGYNLKIENEEEILLLDKRKLKSNILLNKENQLALKRMLKSYGK